MKICDKCENPVKATDEVVVAAEDVHYDLCNRHMVALMEFLNSKEKLNIFGKNAQKLPKKRKKRAV